MLTAGALAGGIGSESKAAQTKPETPASTSFVMSGEIDGIAATSSTNAWAVGYSHDGSTLIAHWNGTRWTRLKSFEPKGDLRAIDIVSPGNAWVIGNSNYYSQPQDPRPWVVHWNGKAWIRAAVPAGTSLGRVTFIPGGTAWASGYGSQSNAPLIFHWSGKAWTIAKNPAANYCGLGTITATSPTNAWAAGWCSGNTLVLHWNGKIWS